MYRILSRDAGQQNSVDSKIFVVSVALSAVAVLACLLASVLETVTWQKGRQSKRHTGKVVGGSGESTSRRCMAISAWDRIDVSSSRRPILLPGEVIVYVQSNVGLYSGKHKLYDYQEGAVYLTGHRICYVDSAKPSLNSLALDLDRVDKIEHYAGFFKSSPKITIRCAGEASLGGISRQSTPLPDALNAAMLKTLGDWVCPICTFNNVLIPGHHYGDVLPACTNCGMKPPRSTKVSHVNSTSSMLHEASTELIQPKLMGSQSPHLMALQSPLTSAKSCLTFPCPRCTFGNHPAITACELCGAPLISRNLPPVLHSNDNRDERDTSPVPLHGNSVREDTSCKLSFRSAGDKLFLEKLRRALADRAWDAKVQPNGESGTVKAERLRRGAGIGALQSREELLNARNATTMTGAFEDLEGLMTKAQDMISMAESFAKRVSSAPSSVGRFEAQSLILESSAALGLSSPIINKESVGKASVYHAEVARQITDFLESGYLRNEGGVMTLVDLYAVYNRALKGSLVSPEDLFAACHMLDSLQLPLKLRKFRSGIVVIQDRSRTDDSTRRAVNSWISSRTMGATALDAAEMFGWSIGVATEELEMVEQHGDIVRDVTVESTRFFDNRIVKEDMTAWLDAFSLTNANGSAITGHQTSDRVASGALVTEVQ